MFTVFSTLRVTNTKHVLCAENENENVRALIQETLEQWHEENNDPRMKYIVNDRNDQVICTIMGMKDSPFVTISFKDGSSAKYKVTQIVHDGKILQTTVTEVLESRYEQFYAETDAGVYIGSK